MPEEAGAVPMREFSRVCEHTIILPAGFSRFQAGTSWVGNQGGQSQEFLGARECLAHIAAHRVVPPARKPARNSPLEAVRRDSQGRYCSLVEERSVNISCLVTSLISGYPVLMLALACKDRFL